MDENSRIQRMDSETALQWLKRNPRMTELKSEFPDEWAQVQQELAGLFGQGNPDLVQQYLKRLSRNVQNIQPPHGRANQKTVDSFVTASVRYRMAHGAVKQHYVSVASGVESGTVRFNLLNGYIAQKLLFAEGLERKPVSMIWFRMFWPMLWQKRVLMPLVQPEGIYCFYSRELISALVQLIGERSCLEIAAGDGTLSRFLTDRGTRVKASDDYSWEHSVRYPAWVERQEAKESLRIHAPEVVICSWPPSGNNFERQVFRTRSVKLYIVIGSRHRHATGNWDDYGEQRAFCMVEDDRLSRLVLPPELDSAVYLFRRKEDGCE